MTNRKRLSNRRRHEAFKIKHWDMIYNIGFGRSIDDETVQEVFIHSGQSGTQAEMLARDSAVILSIALQYGVPKDVLKKSITRNEDGSPAGPIGAIIDLL